MVFSPPSILCHKCPFLNRAGKQSRKGSLSKQPAV
ncbi:hypothetical protein BVRB_2g041760 [Beta vulgaris subsp. vulgaris]|nr:hypothetical protein BVRB_2g041760 [Beta vulgaris subsp. vulgaris]